MIDFCPLQTPAALDADAALNEYEAVSRRISTRLRSLGQRIDNEGLTVLSASAKGAHLRKAALDAMVERSARQSDVRDHVPIVHAVVREAHGDDVLIGGLRCARVLSDGLPMPGYVYAIAGGGRIKIGRAANPLTRLTGVQTGNAIQLTLMGAFFGFDPKPLEKHLHAEFGYLRDRNEWFRESPAIAARFLNHPLYIPARSLKGRPLEDLQAMPEYPSWADLAAGKPVATAKTVPNEPAPDHH